MPKCANSGASSESFWVEVSPPLSGPPFAQMGACCCLPAHQLGAVPSAPPTPPPSVRARARVQADDTEFLGVVADQLFDIGASAVRRHDPAALVFGQRFLSNDAPPPVLAAAGRHFDVVSVQPSDFSPADGDELEAVIAGLVNISKLTGKPVMVADESTHFVEPVRPLFDSAMGVMILTELSSFQSPGVVGTRRVLEPCHRLGESLEA